MAGGMQGGYPSPVPMRRQGNNSVLLWSLVGCGVIAVLLVVIGGFMVKKALKGPGAKGMFNVISSLPTVADRVERVGASLGAYRQDHGGKYPVTLEALVPKYVADKSAFVCGSNDDPKKMEYTAPKPDAADTTVVVRVHLGDIVTYDQRQRMYVCLLKDGDVESEQHTPMTSREKRPAEQKRTY